MDKSGHVKCEVFCVKFNTKFFYSTEKKYLGILLKFIFVSKPYNPRANFQALLSQCIEKIFFIEGNPLLQRGEVSQVIAFLGNRVRFSACGEWRI